MSAAMRKVFAAHQNRGLAFRNADSGDLYDCSCGRRFSDSSQHLADALSAAGFGPVREAKVEALREAAEAVRLRAPDDLSAWEYLNLRAADVLEGQ